MRIPLLAAVLLLPSPTLSQTCSLPVHLYSERIRLEERYIKDVGNNYNQNTAIADDILRQQRSIDQQYLNYMDQVANSAPETVRKCCPPSQRDPVALRVCALSSYLKGGRKDVASFLASVPSDRSSAHSLWLLDEVAHSRGPASDESKLPFQPLGPVSTYINELYTLVLAGDQGAIKKYIGLFALANGDAAEQMEDDIEKLLISKPALVAKNWDSFHEQPKMLVILNEMMPEAKKRQAVSSILRECSARDLSCEGLSSSLK